MNTRESVDPFRRAEQASDSVKAALHNVASDAGAKFYGAYAHSKDQIDHAINAASDSVERAEEFLIKKIKANPVSAAAVALGAGVVLGLLVSRRN